MPQWLLIIGGMLMGFGGVWILAAILAPTVEQAFRINCRLAVAEGWRLAARRISRHGREVNAKLRSPEKYADRQVEDLMFERRYEEARSLAEERLRTAYEQGLDDRVQFYRKYLEEIGQGERQA